jgi:flagellar basal-body rod modification protein FlgD
MATPILTDRPAASGAPSPASVSTSKQTVDKNMFLQLLVAQLRNQDPLSPTDGTQFVGELAQFQQLEQAVNTGQDVAAIRQDVDALVGANKNSISQS